MLHRMCNKKSIFYKARFLFTSEPQHRLEKDVSITYFLLKMWMVFKFKWTSLLQWITSPLPLHISLHVFLERTPFIMLRNYRMCHACSHLLKNVLSWIGQRWTPVGRLCARLCARVCLCKSRLLFIGRYLSVNVFSGRACARVCVLILSFWFPFSQMPNERSKSTQRNK